MKLIRLVMTTVAAIALAALTAAFAQGTPDFSGRWKANPETAPLAPPPPPPPPPPSGGGLKLPPPPPPQTIEITIAQTPTEIRLDRLMAAGDRQIVQKFAYKLDGTESTNQMGPITSRSTAAWEGATLVISSILSVDGKDLGNSKEVYSFDGAQLLIEYSRTTPATSIIGRTTFTRVES